MTEPDAQLFRLPDHEIIKDSGGWAFRCPDWNMWWRYGNKKSAEFFLSAHLAYPVAPCKGVVPDAG